MATNILAEGQPRGAASPQALDAAIKRALGWLDDNQEDGGFWVGMLESNSCIEAEWLLAMHFLGIDDAPKRDGLVRALLAEQREDGSWETYHDAPRGDINATVESYAALRACGFAADDPVIVRAREWIFANGGLGGLRVFSRYWLALIGEWPWESTPNLPPEIIFLPSWMPFNIYNFASWARATMMPLAVLCARRSSRPLPPEARLDELFPDGRDTFDYRMPNTKSGSWREVFLKADRALHAYQNFGITPGRNAAIRLVLDWVVKHQDQDGAWGGIQPPWIYSLLMLYEEGYSLEHPVLKRGIEALDSHWSYERDGAIYIQASESPVWDTLLSLLAMQDCECDYASTPSMQRAVEWVLEQQVRVPGDWSVKVPNATPGGWAFERANLHYPDIDDTAVALIVLARLRGTYPDQARLQRAIDDAVGWTLAMQSSNGGWAAFDKDNDHEILTQLPFCDFGEVLDPPSVDVTAHVVEALGLLGMDRREPALAKALDYIRREQEPDGSWFGRWGVNHIYGTAAVLPALKAVGEDMRSVYVVRAADWLVQTQCTDGGWGESCASYMDARSRGKGESTASQTGWALMALIATGNRRYRDAIQRGLDYLTCSQLDEGTWDEPHYTGTGFPGYGVGARLELDGKDQTLEQELHQSTELGRGFMINYNMYRHYFPLMALGRAREYLASLTA
ncbi:MAG: squalene--hopene cyclase [Pseudomonadota bacterium]